MLESRALRGAVAQLGERRVRNAKVEGSIPFRSTIKSPDLCLVWHLINICHIGHVLQ